MLNQATQNAPFLEASQVQSDVPCRGLALKRDYRRTGGTGGSSGAQLRHGGSSVGGVPAATFVAFGIESAVFHTSRAGREPNLEFILLRLCDTGDLDPLGVPVFSA